MAERIEKTPAEIEAGIELETDESWVVEVQTRRGATPRVIPRVPPVVPPLKPATTRTVRGRLFYSRTWDHNDSTQLLSNPVKEFLPGVKLELLVQPAGDPGLAVHATAHASDRSSRVLTDDPPLGGDFEFSDIPADATRLALRVHLEHEQGLVRVLGKTNAVQAADFRVESGQVISAQFELDQAKDDLGEVALIKAAGGHSFEFLCDAYKALWLGQKRIRELVGQGPERVDAHYPDDGDVAFFDPDTGLLHVPPRDVRDRDMILHEFGHALQHFANPGLLADVSTTFDDDPNEDHGVSTFEHYETAWVEGSATFLGCFLQDDPIFHNGFNTKVSDNLTVDLGDVTQGQSLGPHTEGSVQAGLWSLCKVSGVDFALFWKAFTDKGASSVGPRDSFEFVEAWRRLGLGEEQALLRAWQFTTLDAGYRYLSGAARWTKGESFDSSERVFSSVTDLHERFAEVPGESGGDLDVTYTQEFYNRNKRFNPGSLGPNPKTTIPANSYEFELTNGVKYIVPVKSRVTQDGIVTAS